MSSTRRCRLARAILPYVDGELSTDEALRFEEHLPLCASCRSAVGAQRALEEALVALPQPRILLPDRARLLAGIGARIADRATAAAQPARTRERMRRVAAGVGALAAAAAIVLGGLALRRPSPRVARGEPEPIASGPAIPDAPDAPSLLTDAPPDAPPTIEPPTAPALSGAILVAAHDELARVLYDLSRRANALAADDLLTTFSAAVQPLRAASIPLSAVMSTLLTDPDPALACAAADLLARATVSGEMLCDEPWLVPRLDDVMRRPDRGVAMLNALVAIGTPRAWQAVGRATQMRHVRPHALRALARSDDPALLPRLGDELAATLGEPGGASLVARVLDDVDVARTEQVHLLAQLVRAGIDDAPVAAALERAGARATALVAAGLAGRDRAARRDALLLAPLTRDESLAEALAPLAMRGDESVAALQALARIGGERPLEQLLRMAADPSLSNSRGRAVAAAFSTALDSTADVAAVLELLRGRQPDLGPLLCELARFAAGPGGRVARITLAGDAAIARRSRAALALEIATRREPVTADAVLGWLRSSAPVRGADDDEGFTAALLVLLYAVDGDEGLDRGALALGLEPRRPGQARLREAARLVVGGTGSRRDLARVDALLKLAP